MKHGTSISRRDFLVAGAAAAAVSPLRGVLAQNPPGNKAKITLSRDHAHSLFKEVAAWIHQLKIDAECMAVAGDRPVEGLSIFIRGECARLLGIAAGELQEPRYREAVLGSAKLLASRQLPEGVWNDGILQGNIYLCDSTQACNALYSALPFASNSQKRAFLTALDAFANYLRYGSDTDPSGMGRGGSRGFLFPDGSVGLGYRHNDVGPDGVARPHLDATPFPVASGIVGARFSSMYASLNQSPFFKAFSKQSIEWLSRTGTTPEGYVRYYLPPRQVKGTRWELALTAYCGEGWLWTLYQTVDGDEERKTLKDAARKWIDWIVSTQNDRGLWDRGDEGNMDRSPLAPLFLMGYHNLFGDREDVVAAINKFLANVADPARRDAFFFMRRKRSTVFTGLMLAEYLWPGRAFGRVASS
jgi:hypothetical protein